MTVLLVFCGAMLRARSRLVKALRARDHESSAADIDGGQYDRFGVPVGNVGALNNHSLELGAAFKF